MKKMIFALIALVVALPMVAQESKIVLDEVSSDGLRTIKCNVIGTRSFSDKHVFYLGLSAINDTLLLNVRVNASKDYEISQGMVLLVKTSEEKVLTLMAKDSQKAELKDSVWTGINYLYSYGADANYIVTAEQLELMKKGVTKLRQEVVAGKHEKTYKKDKIGQIIKDQHKLINEALATEKAFDSDF